MLGDLQQDSNLVRGESGFFPFCGVIFLQYQPVLCKVSGNLSERVFLLELGFVMIGVLKLQQSNKAVYPDRTAEFGCSRGCIIEKLRETNYFVYCR